MQRTQTTPSAGVGTSTALDSEQAGAEAAKTAMEHLESGSCDFVLVFGGMGYEHRGLLRGVRSVTGNAPLVGCSTQGVVGSRWARESPRAVAVMALRSRDLTFTHGVCEGLSRDSYEVGRKIGRDLLASPPDHPVVLFCVYDPLTGVNVDRLLGGLESVRSIPVVGGAASQPWGRFVETRQYFDGEPLQDAAACVLVSGAATAEIGVTHGAVPLGMEATITRAEGNIIYEIDGRPAYRAWRDQVSAQDDFSTEDTAQWAIGIRPAEILQGDYEGCVTRSLFKVDPESGSIYLQSEIPEGSRVVFHRRTFEAVIDRAARMGERLGQRIGDRSPYFALSFECGARSSPFLGHPGALDELCRVQAAIGAASGAEIPWLGMYAWGEIAPLGGRNYFHNYTFPVCVLLPDR